MGVEYSYGACYGVLVGGIEDGDKLDEILRVSGQKPALAYMEWGSRCYGGGGFIVCIAGAGWSGDVHEPPVRLQVSSRDETKFIDKVRMLSDDGRNFTINSEPGWFAFGRVF